MTKAPPDGLPTILEREEQLAPTRPPDVREAVGKARVHVMALDPGVLALSRGPSPARVAAERLEEQLHHVALAMVRRGLVRKDQQFHNVRAQTISVCPQGGKWQLKS